MKIYTTKSKYNCGPCSSINLTGIKGSKKVETWLAKNGKLKPFKASSYTAFLVWADKYKKDIVIYTASKKLKNNLFKMMFDYEKIPKELQKDYKKQGLERFNRLNKKFSHQIKALKNPIKKLDELLKENYKVAVLTSSFYMSEDAVPHWIVAFKKEKDKYHFMCSQKGLITLKEKDLLKGFKLNKKLGSFPVLVAYRK
jgi:hypothetical protein